MEVTRVHTGGRSSHIEPPLDKDWSQFEKLQWQAAVISLDGGVEVEVLSHNNIYFQVNVGPSWDRHHISGLTFESAWTLMTGIGLGTQASRDREKN